MNTQRQKLHLVGPEDLGVQEALAITAADLAPVLLTRDEMVAKLAAMRIAQGSPLGRHVLAGGALFDLKGQHLRLATPENVAKFDGSKAHAEATEPPFSTAAQRRQEPATLLDRAIAAYLGDPEPRPATRAAPPTSQKTTNKSLLDRAADVWCSPVGA